MSGDSSAPYESATEQTPADVIYRGAGCKGTGRQHGSPAPPLRCPPGAGFITATAAAPDKAHLLPSWWLNCGKALQNDGQQFGRTSISRTSSLMRFNCLLQ